MSKMETIADAIGAATEHLITACQADMGLFIPMKDGAMGMFLGGKKGEFGENINPFLKECIKRMEEVIKANESGNINLGSDSKFVYDTKAKTFKPMADSEQEGGFAV